MAPHQRLHRVSKLSSTLKRNGYPRLTMLMIVGGAGVTAFLSSALMLAAGLRYMPVRYAIASLLGYAVFVWLVRGWLAARDRREAAQQLVADSVDASVDVLNVTDLPGAVIRTVGRGGRPAPVDIFQGGNSGGGGATAAFGGPAPMPAMVVPPVSSESGGGLSWAADLDDDGLKLLPLFAVAAIAVGLFAAGSVVWSAPQLLAEILVDGAIAGQAYRGLRKATGRAELCGELGNPCSPSF